MIIAIRILFVIVSTTVGFLLADSLNINLFVSVFIGFFGSVLVVLLDIVSKRISLEDLVIAGFGLIFGLVIAYLVSYAISLGSFIKGGEGYIPVILYLVFGYFGMAITVMRKEELAFLKIFFREDKKIISDKILDTSVIIDGRVSDILNTGFLEGTLLIPEFVLQELQRVADSQDTLKRARGRRGLEMLNALQAAGNKVKIINKDVNSAVGVDEKLIAIAKLTSAPVITNDYNLNRVAKIHGVKILNINDLANAVKPVVLPGEPMTVKIIKEGKEAGQGIAYMEDGTMIVVENGKNFLNQTIDVIVTSILQTSAGRIIFTKPVS